MRRQLADVDRPFRRKRSIFATVCAARTVCREYLQYRAGRGEAESAGEICIANGGWCLFPR